MHEMSIAQNIIDIVRDEMKKHNVEKLSAVNISVGKLSAIVPSSLTFCHQIIIEGTDLEGLRLNIREVPLGYRCFDCGHEFTSEDMVFTCPECEAENPMLTTGRDMTIDSIEVAD